MITEQTLVLSLGFNAHRLDTLFYLYENQTYTSGERMYVPPRGPVGPKLDVAYAKQELIYCCT